MFEALDTIEWSHLDTCYGYATAIPTAIRGLTSDDAHVRQGAFGTLHMELVYEETVYQAAVYVIPFLLEILAAPYIQDKYQLVHLLACLGSRSAHLENHLQPLYERLSQQHRTEMTGNAFLEDLQFYLTTCGESAHQAIREGLLLLLQLLGDPDPVIRMEIVFLFAAYKEDASRLLSPIQAQLKAETDEYVQCCLLLCLGHLLTPTFDASQLLMQYLIEGRTPFLQFIAATALCILLKEKIPEEAVHVLLAVLADPHLLQPFYKHLPLNWGNCRVHRQALFYLDQLMSSPHQALILDRLVEIFPLLDEDINEGCVDWEESIHEECAGVLLRIAFYEKGFQFNPVMTFSDLDPMQQRILQMFATKETLWIKLSWDSFLDNNLNLISVPAPVRPLASLGLPSTRQSLQAFIAPIAPSVNKSESL